MKIQLTFDNVSLWNKIQELASRVTISQFLLFYLAAHMLQIMFPSNGDCSTSCIFDESYVVSDALNLLHHGIGTVRLPLPSIFGAIGIYIFGNASFGWRIFPVLFQVGAVYFFYLVAKRFIGPKWGLASAVLLALDPVWFIHGGLLLNDTTMFFFALGATELYFRKRYWSSALFMGLAFLSREMSLFWFASLVLYTIYVNRKSKTLKSGIKIGIKYVVVSGAITLLLLSAYDYSFHPPIGASAVSANVFSNVVVNGTTPMTTITSTIYSTSTAAINNAIQHILAVEHNFGPGAYPNAGGAFAPYKYPWAWILPFDYVNGTLYQAVFVGASYLSSVVTVTVNGVSTSTTLHYYSYQPDPALWYGFWPALIAGIYALVKRKEVEAAVFILGGMLINYVPWLILGIEDSTRIGFNFYFIYTLPFIALGEVYAWRKLPRKYGKPVMAVNLIIALAFFIWFFPSHAIVN